MLAVAQPRDVVRWMVEVHPRDFDEEYPHGTFVRTEALTRHRTTVGYDALQAWFREFHADHQGLGTSWVETQVARLLSFRKLYLNRATGEAFT